MAAALSGTSASAPSPDIAPQLTGLAKAAPEATISKTIEVIEEDEPLAQTDSAESAPIASAADTSAGADSQQAPQPSQTTTDTSSDTPQGHPLSASPAPHNKHQDVQSGAGKTDERAPAGGRDSPEASPAPTPAPADEAMGAKADAAGESQSAKSATSHQHHHKHHQHHHHQHHHHHHHHPHGHHHHHHHHRQCPHHKHHQQQKQTSTQGEAGDAASEHTSDNKQPEHQPADKDTKPEDHTHSAAIPGRAGGHADPVDAAGKERSMYAKKRSVGSVDQFIRVPSLTAGSARRKSECNRMLSMGEDASGAPANKPTLSERPASACCPMSKEPVSPGAARERDKQRESHEQLYPQPVVRKSSLNLTRPSDTDRNTSAGAGQHSPLKVTQSVSATTSSSAAELTATSEGGERQYIGDLERELEALKVRLDRRIGGVKMSKVTQSYLSYFKQWAEYDPFIAQPIPSNPWISDSTELWDSERQTKDVHCRRVRRWAFSLKELLNDPAGREQFHRFLEKEFSAENLK